MNRLASNQSRPEAQVDHVAGIKFPGDHTSLDAHRSDVAGSKFAGIHGDTDAQSPCDSSANYLATNVLPIAIVLVSREVDANPSTPVGSRSEAASVHAITIDPAPLHRKEGA